MALDPLAPPVLQRTGPGRDNRSPTNVINNLARRAAFVRDHQLEGSSPAVIDAQIRASFKNEDDSMITRWKNSGVYSS